MANVGMGYDSGGLRRGADHHAGAHAACMDLGDVLAGIVLAPGICGAVPAAAGFHAAVSAVRSRQFRDAAAEAGRRSDLADRARTAASDGDGLTDDTIVVARSASQGADPR